MPIRTGLDAPIIGITRGGTHVTHVRRGGALVWTSAMIRDDFNQYAGTGNWLQDWINDLVSDLGALVSNAWGQLVDGLNNIIGSTVAFVQGGINQVGQLVSHTGTALVDAYCAAWGGTPPSGGVGVTPPPDGLLGMLNGIPIIGPGLSFLAAQITSFISSLSNITSLVGQIPVVGDLARLIGLVPDTVTGLLAAPVNFVVDALGEVIGTITCGRYTAVSAAEEAVNYVIGQVNGAARLLIPDGLLSLDTQTSVMRYPTLLSGDNGYLEVKVADYGTPGMITRVFRRFANDGSAARGVGFELRDSGVSIVRRVGGVDTLMKPGVSAFTPGDRLRLIQNEDVHTLKRNGHVVGEWDDLGDTAARGASNRSVGMLMQGGKELLGQRRYSPALTYLEAA